MSSMISAPLNTESFGSPDIGPKISPAVLSYWVNQGYTVDRAVDAYTVISIKEGKENTSHVVQKVATYDKPILHVDVVEDVMHKWVRDCKDYRHNQGVDLEERTLSEWDHCKHIEHVIENHEQAASK